YSPILGTAGGLHAKEFFVMCDYSLHNVRSRPAKIGDKLVTTNFRTGTRGFASPADLNTAVCVPPGPELAFSDAVRHEPRTVRSLVNNWLETSTSHTTTIFRQINRDKEHTHHDALEFPDGQTVLLTCLHEGQEATVLQLPAEPRTAEEVTRQQREPIVA